MPRKKTAVLILIILLLALLPVPGWGTPEELKEAAALNDKVGQLSRAGGYKEALPLAQKALQIRYKDLGPEHPDIAVSLTTLGQVYQEMGNLNDALPLLERALQIRYKALRPADPAIAASLNNLGALYLRRGEYDKAQPLLERALRSRERELGPDHIDTAASLDTLAAFYKDKKEYDQALPLYERALKIREKALSANNPETAETMTRLAELYRLRGNYDKALPLNEKALQINQLFLGPFHLNTAASLNNLALVYDKLGFYSKAQPHFERALQIRQKILGLEHPGTAQSLNNLGLTYYRLKEYDKALPLYERALAIREKAGGPEHADTAETLNNMGLLYKDLGAADKALDFYQRALQIREKTLGPDNPETIATVENLAAFYADARNLSKAAPFYERLVKGKEKIFGPDHLETAASLTQLAQVYQNLGEYDKALAVSRRGLTIREKVLGAEHPDTIASLNSLAGLYAGTGAYEKSLPLYERVLQIKEKTLGPDKPETAIVLNNLALAYQGLGDYDKAMALYNRSLKIKETVPELEQAGTARTLSNLASLHQARGDFDNALPLLENVVTMKEKIPGPDSLETAAALDNLAGLYVAMGVYDKALPLYKRAEKIYEQSRGPTHLDTGMCKHKLATLYEMMGAGDKALPLYEQAARSFAKQLGAYHPDTARIFVTIGLIYLSKNDSEKAENAFKQVKAKEVLADLALKQGRPEEAWQLLEEMTPPPASTPVSQLNQYVRKGRALAGVGRLPDAAVALWQAVQGSDKRPLKSWNIQYNRDQQAQYLRPYRQLTEVLTKLALKGEPLPPELQELGPSPQGAALSMAEAAKDRHILAALSLAPRNSRRPELAPELRQREETLQFHLAAQEAQWERAVLGGQEGLKEVINNRKKQNTAYEDLVQELRLTHPLYAALYYPRAAPVKNLPLTDNEVVIEYFLGEEAGAIFVVRRDGVQFLYPLPLGRKALETRVQEVLEPLVAGKTGEFPVQKAKELFDLLLAKPLSTITPEDQIIIVPDGILGALPFEALTSTPGPNPETSIFVGDQRTLWYYPSVTVLAQQRGRAEKLTPRPLFALGMAQFFPTPGSGRDVEAKKPDDIAGLEDGNAAADRKIKKEKKAPEAVGKTTPNGYLALAANAARRNTNQGVLYPLLPAAEAELLDLAGIFQVAAEPPDVLQGRQANKVEMRQAPLADYRYLHLAAPAELTDEIQGLLEPFILLGPGRGDAADDLFLRLSEILDLDLGARLVALPYGQGIQGQGVINLARAFQYAGARSVLVNLWNKDSEVARKFLVTFYQHLQAGNSPGEALYLARSGIRSAHPDPVFWAGFMLYGEG